LATDVRTWSTGGSGGWQGRIRSGDEDGIANPSHVISYHINPGARNGEARSKGSGRSHQCNYYYEQGRRWKCVGQLRINGGPGLFVSELMFGWLRLPSLGPT
jgi:hypothetical protein